MVISEQHLQQIRILYELQTPKIQLNKGVIQTNGKLVSLCEHINRNSFCTVYECLHDKPFNIAFEHLFYKNPSEPKKQNIFNFNFKPNTQLNINNSEKK